MSGIEGVGGAANTGNIKPGSTPTGDSANFSETKVKSMNDLKSKLVEKLGTEEGTQKFEDFQKMLCVSMIQQMQKTADHALETQKKARRGQ